MSLKAWDACFPTVVGVCERKDLLTDVQNVFNRKIDKKYFEYQTQETFNVLTPNLKNKFEDEVSNFLSEVLKIKSDIQLTTSWFTHKSSGSHSHTNSWWSACYYLVDDAQIQISKKAPSICVLPSEWNLNASLDVEYKLNAGDMLIFPSTTTHKALDYIGEGKRYSLAMNFMPKGSVGFYDSSFTYESN